MLADMATEIDAARLLVHRAAWLAATAAATSTRPMSKLKAGRAAVWATERAIQILGGYGYTASTASSACTATPRSSTSTKAPSRSSSSSPGPSPACASSSRTRAREGLMRTIFPETVPTPGWHRLRALMGRIPGGCSRGPLGAGSTDHTGTFGPDRRGASSARARCRTPGPVPHRAGPDPAPRGPGMNVTVGDIMTSPAMTVMKHHSAEHAVALMRDHRVPPRWSDPSRSRWGSSRPRTCSSVGPIRCRSLRS